MNLDQFEKTMMKNSFGDTMMPDDIQPPTAQHLKQVVQSLINFQYFYSLEPQQIMNGTFMGLQLNTSLPLDSCYFIGKTCFELNEHADASDWLKAYLSLSADDEEHRKKVNKLLYPSYIFLDYVYDAFIAASNYLKDDPHNIPATDAVLDLSLQLGKLNSYGLSSIETHRLCRGEYDAKSAVAQLNLKCRYKHDGSAFLKIAPLKEEELYNDPKILLYREVLYDSEIEKMKAWAAQNLNVATVVARSGQSEKAFNYRISETGFMPNQSPEFSNLYKRIEDISEFHLQVGEMWQFLGYMPGGHYAMHSDYLPDKDNTVQSYGNREISMLFYLNEVSLGGETVFTRLRLAVKPIRGAAILWYNLQADGSYNYKTDHCACPVIIGEKWGFTQWIRSKDQQCLRQIFENNSTKKFSQTNKILKNLN
ncbi:prolyl 4-hydroxylase subunit alpha-2-like [Planococcus citri]|uniref:prolyl 4-hydroxylase subunit alpha-2-like n=1 Tax=Planococcus citri TaxID=170843 RepID=UPI0031F8C904